MLAFVQAPGVILRCSACEGIMLRIVQTPEAGLAMSIASWPAPVLMSSGEPGPLSVPSGANANTSMSSGPVLVQV